jgi:hypothetical protein
MDSIAKTLPASGDVARGAVYLFLAMALTFPAMLFS